MAEIRSANATLTTANVQALAANSGSGQGNPERIEVAATANFDQIGDIVFLLDAGDITNSTLVQIKDVAANDYVVNMDDLAGSTNKSAEALIEEKKRAKEVQSAQEELAIMGRELVKAFLPFANLLQKITGFLSENLFIVKTTALELIVIFSILFYCFYSVSQSTI